MNIQREFSIKGVGKYLPTKVVHSQQIEKDLGIPEGYIMHHIGVGTRHIAEEETNTYMAESALREALNDANLNIRDIDCLIGASATFDYIIPNRSCLIKSAFQEAENLDFPCLDINTVCTSFIAALDYAALLLSTGEYQNIAIVSSEIASKGLNPNDVETFSLFGDGAAAVIVSQTTQNAGLLKHLSKTYVQGVKHTIIEAGGNANHTRDVPYDAELYSFKMEGTKLLRQVKPALTDYLQVFFGQELDTMRDVDLIVPHQASKLGFKMLEHLCHGQELNVVNQLERYGNCIAASIPIALVTSIEESRLKEGDTCLMLGTAAGITISGILFKYSRL